MSLLLRRSKSSRVLQIGKAVRPGFRPQLLLRQTPHEMLEAHPHVLQAIPDYHRQVLGGLMGKVASQHVLVLSVAALQMRYVRILVLVSIDGIHQLFDVALSPV